MRRSWLRLFWLIVVFAGAVAGYLVSSGLGTRLLHQEIETQLTRLLEGPVEIGEVQVRWEAGIRVEARAVSAYPNPALNTPPALRARRVLAWVDLVSLLIGRLELSRLTLEGPHLRIARNADGSFIGLPLPPVSSYPDPGPDGRSAGERFFARLGTADLTAAAAIEGFRIADRIEIVDGTVSWIERPRADSTDEPKTYRVELLNGIAERDWLSRAFYLSSEGVFLDGQHAPFRFTAAVERDEDQPLVWSIAIEKIPLEAAKTTLAFINGIEGLDGSIDVQVRLETIAEGQQRLTVDGKIDNAKIELRRSKTILEQGRAEVHAEIVFDPDWIRLASSRLTANRFSFDLKGVMQRPIRPASPTRVESRVEGILLEDLRDYARSLEGESETALTLSRLTERVQSGHIKYIEASGSTLLSRWQDLLSGRARELPDGFVLGGSFDQVNVQIGPTDVIEDLEAEIEWLEDQIILRNGNATFRGGPLPQINAVINGVSHLVRTSDSARRITTLPPSLPGLRPLSQILAPKDPDALPPIKAIGLHIEYLEHPIFHLPLRDLRVLIEPLRRGLEVTVREGTWGGAPVSGEVVWFDDPVAPSLSATLTLAQPAPQTSAKITDKVKTLPRAAPPNRWAAGQLEMEFRPRPRLPFQRATGFFRLEDANLIGNDLEIQVDDQGTIATRLNIGLEHPDSVDFDASFALTDGRLANIGPFVALPVGLATGGIGATGSLNGQLRPNQSFIAELDGRVRAEAKDGRVHSNLPLMFRLAKATEGYNPFADQGELQYETMAGSFDIAHGLLSVSDFEIEGPLRVYARADIDTNVEPATIRAVVGIFLFRKSSQFLDSLPLIRSFLPGSERGLIGTYFDVEGPLNSPDVEALPLQTLMSGVPNAIKAPIKALRILFDRGQDES